MNITGGMLLEALFLTSALSLDAMISGFAYGTNRIKIPFSSTIVINIICSMMLGISLIAGRFINRFIPGEVATGVCFALLFLLGIVKLFDSFLKTWIKKTDGIDKKINFSFHNVRFILNIYANPEIADKDESRVLSITEAASLAIALSLDSLTVGIGAGLMTNNILLILTFSFITGMIAVVSGCYFGNRIVKKVDLNLSWIGGALLIVLAFMRFL